MFTGDTRAEEIGAGILGREFTGMTFGGIEGSGGAGSRMTVNVAARRFCERLNREKPLRKFYGKVVDGLPVGENSVRNV